MTFDDVDFSDPTPRVQAGTNGHHPLDTKISIVPDAIDTRTTHISFRSVLADIQNGRWRTQVRKVRAAYEKGGKDLANPIKKWLPAALFSGIFTAREDTQIESHSGLICVDLDGLDERLESVRDIIVADPHTVAAFRSPTGSGLKVIFRCSADKDDHLKSYRAAEHFVLTQFGLEIDPACKNVSRMCFVSDDPELFQADDATPLPPAPEPTEFKAPVESKTGSSLLAGLKPGDDYDQRANIPALLQQHGWTKWGRHGWMRPGGSQLSATWDKVPGRFYVFSSSTGFEPNHVYRPWHVYAHLEHGGDFTAASKALYAQGYGERVQSLPQSTSQAQSRGNPEPSDPLPSKGFMEFTLPEAGDSSILIGDRYLCRADGAIITSTSGMGKSSLSLQMATAWALGRPVFDGLRPNGPLRSLIFQAEDSEGDMAEVKLGMIHGFSLTKDEQSLVSERVRIITDRVHRGLSFYQELKRQVEIHKPDIVWINPLLAFIGGDVNDAEAAGQFLREQLNSLNEPPRFAYIIIHHTAKPPKEATTRRWNEVMYDMAGSADLTNWARAIISLRPADEEGEFNLVLAKRGLRAGFTRKAGEAGSTVEPTTTIGLRHSKDRLEVQGRAKSLPAIFWEHFEAAAPSKPKHSGRPAGTVFADIALAFPEGGSSAQGFRPIMRAAKELRPNIGTSTLVRIIDEAIEDGMLKADLSNPRAPKYYRG
jgi:hypothetical protein